METTLFKIKFKDGREFKVFCANRSQKARLLWSILKKDLVIEDRDNGIHNIKQWEQIVANLNK